MGANLRQFGSETKQRTPHPSAPVLPPNGKVVIRAEGDLFLESILMLRIAEYEDEPATVRMDATTLTYQSS
jgi:hypothetical protein